jgi:hypothetical protein
MDTESANDAGGRSCPCRSTQMKSRAAVNTAQVLVTTTSAAAATAHDVVLDRRDSSECVYVVEPMQMDITAIHLKCVVGWVAPRNFLRVIRRTKMSTRMLVR